MEKRKKQRILFHGVKDIEIGHLITLYESKLMDLAVVAFIIGQMLFLTIHPNVAASLKMNHPTIIPFAHLMTFLGEAFLLWCLMIGMKVLRKPFHSLFIATLIGLAIIHVTLAISQASTIEREIPYEIPIFIICAIPYALLGYKINHSYYGDLSSAGNWMILFILANALYLIAKQVIGANIIIDLICLTIGIYYIFFLRSRLIGCEKVEDISYLKNETGKHKMKKMYQDEVIRKSNKDDIEVDYIITTQSNISIKAAVALFILGQAIFFLCAPFISSLIGVNRVVLLGTSHFLKGLGETYLLYCLMKGLENLKHPLRKPFQTAIALNSVFYSAVTLLCLVTVFGVHELGNSYFYLLVLRIFPYFILAFCIYHFYYGALSNLGMFMMVYLLAKTLVDGFNFTGMLLYTDVIILALSVAYALFFNKWLIGEDKFKDIEKKQQKQKEE